MATNTIFQKLHHIATLKQLLNLSGKNCILPFYHTVSSNKLPHIHNLYQYRSIEQFKEDIKFLCTNFTPVTVDELYEITLQNKKPKKPVFHLTFDDGLREIYTHVAPILTEAKVPATIFLNSAFVDNKTLFFRYKVSLIIDKINHSEKRQSLRKVAELLQSKSIQKTILIQILLSLNYYQVETIDAVAHLLSIDYDTFLKEQLPYLTTNQITELKNSGFTFGAHSIDHPLFSDITEKEQKRQVTTCFEALDNIIETDQHYFAFPFSDNGVSTDYLNWLHKQQGCRLSFGTAGVKDDTSLFNLQRIPMEKWNQSAKSIVKTELVAYLLKKLLGKNRISR